MTETYTGTIEKATFAAGSKSEHETLVLKTAEGDSYKLRLRGTSSFDSTPFKPFLGKEVTISGRTKNGQIMINDLSDISVSPETPRTPKPPTP